MDVQARPAAMSTIHENRDSFSDGSGEFAASGEAHHGSSHTRGI